MQRVSCDCGLESVAAGSLKPLMVLKQQSCSCLARAHLEMLQTVTQHGRFAAEDGFVGVRWIVSRGQSKQMQPALNSFSFATRSHIA